MPRALSGSSKGKNKASQPISDKVKCPNCPRFIQPNGLNSHLRACKRNTVEAQACNTVNDQIAAAQQQACIAQLREDRHVAASISAAGPFGQAGVSSHQTAAAISAPVWFNRAGILQHPSILSVLEHGIHSWDSNPIQSAEEPYDSVQEGVDHEMEGAQSYFSIQSVDFTATALPSTLSMLTAQDFKTMYHPKSSRPEKLEPWDKFRNLSHVPPIVLNTDEDPWQPFKSCGDCEFTSIAIDAELTQTCVDCLLKLVRGVAAGNSEVTFHNDADLRSTCDKAAEELTPVETHEVAFEYKAEEIPAKVHTRDLWGWMKELLDNKTLAPHFEWDAQCVYKRDANDEFDGMDIMVDYESRKTAAEEDLKVLGLRPVENIFWKLVHGSGPHNALSFDRLHFNHGGVFGWHILPELQKILRHVSKQQKQPDILSQFDWQFDGMPHWQNLNHFSHAVNTLFSDGNKFHDMSKQILYAAQTSYVEFDTWVGLDIHTEATLKAGEVELIQFNLLLDQYMTIAAESGVPDIKTDWDFPKVHYFKHAVEDICNKGAS
ncbi:hypothetical protein CONPUDRAFT_152026 [Coniophora puteana RWD-64-598 SS2]|uniref:Uncharacterized protein n=1 Tax=Coniophora puteana (strain RWD-64-598) TaxID=741705 RepID=A0A5M3MUY0_CONPW|nr:uncharacterized protein CONPUDRAFT_152026 [Coniophora puteana RWD-64-598 SS2]EIW82982.1 hypothetical protein CONPUDRAFT_152026 [Coniophora puteana RWD-64-598 SS2]